MNNQVESLKRERTKILRELEHAQQELEHVRAELALGRCGSCKKACEAGIMNKKVCDPK